MKNLTLAQKIKECRISSGSSQEELAEKTQLSLRTIQRIENGETQPRGDSLKRLALALGVATEELTADQRDQPGRQGQQVDNRGFLIVLNLSALAFLVFPGLGVAVPLILWLLNRDRVKGAYAMGRKILNFQMTWLSLFVLVYGSAFYLKLTHTALPFHLSPGHIWMVLLLLYAFNINCIVVNAVRANRDKATNYAPAIPFIRITPSC